MKLCNNLSLSSRALKVKTVLEVRSENFFTFLFSRKATGHGKTSPEIHALHRPIQFMELIKLSTETSSGNSVTGNSSCPIQSQTTMSNIHVSRGICRSTALTGCLMQQQLPSHLIRSSLVLAQLAPSNSFVRVRRHCIRRRHDSTHRSDLTPAEVVFECSANTTVSSVLYLLSRYIQTFSETSFAAKYIEDHAVFKCAIV